MNYLRCLALVLLVVITCSGRASALSTMPDKPQTASISLGAEFATGKYGTDTTTRSVYMPLIATWSPTDRFDIGVELPFIYQSSSNVTTSLFSNNQSTVTTKTTFKGGPGGNSQSVLQQQAGNNTASGSSDSSVSGLGDIIMRFGIIALFEADKTPQLRPSLYVKFPTASTNDGLGTGEFDGGIGLEATKWFDKLHLTGEGFFNWQGKADGFGLQNYFSYTAGVGYLFTNSFESGFIVKGATAPSTYSGDLLELRARMVWSLNDTTALDLFGSHGIADSSPDYGGGITVIYSF